MMQTDTSSLVEKNCVSMASKRPRSASRSGFIAGCTLSHVGRPDSQSPCVRPAARCPRRPSITRLNLFSRKGIVREVAVDPGHLVYDSTTAIFIIIFSMSTPAN